MSKKGIQLVAKLFADMQALRIELLGMGELQIDKADKHADFLLAQMIENGKDAMSDDFMQITSGRFPHEKPETKKKKTLGKKNGS
jgi:hypothetical protein